jgi:hypothetical protein
MAEHWRRPVLELTAVLFHGVGTYLFISDENCSTGANWHIECVMRSLEFGHRRCERMRPGLAFTERMGQLITIASAPSLGP